MKQKISPEGTVCFPVRNSLFHVVEQEVSRHGTFSFLITRTHKINAPKTRTSNRIISIDNILANELKEYMEDYNINNNLFEISFSTLKRKKDYYCDKAHVKRIKIHEFRHSHACLLFKNDVPIDEISYRLGHSRISITTDTYLKYLPKQEKRVISTLNSLRSC